MKNKETGGVFFVVVFTLVPLENLDEDEVDGQKNGEDKGTQSKVEFEPSADDVD